MDTTKRITSINIALRLEKKNHDNRKNKGDIRMIIGRLIINNIDIIGDQFRETKQAKHDYN